MINNIEYILPLFYFNEANNMFYHVQIIQRNKDFPERTDKEPTVKSYFIKSREHLETVMPEIMLLCEFYKARAYFNPCAKDFGDLQKDLTVAYATHVRDKAVCDCLRTLNSAATCVRPVQKVWVVDIDSPSQVDQVYDWIYNWFLEEYKKGPATLMPKSSFAKASMIAKLPTKSGYHLLVRPFHREKFRVEFPDVSIHDKSAGTLLYYPSSLDTEGTPDGSSAELWMKWLRDGYGIALNICAHDGDFYTWDVVHLKKYTGEPIMVDLKSYDSYDSALKAGVIACLKHLNI